MKKSVALILGAIGASALLAGGTIAAYVVTDNANPFGIKISPTAITEDKVGNITLEWGEYTVADVSNLTAGQTAKAGNLILKATGKTYDSSGSEETVTSYEGKLTLALTDLTEYETSYSGAKLKDYIQIDVFAGDVSKDDVDFEHAYDETNYPTGYLGHIPTSTSEWTIDLALEGTPTGTTYSVFVTLSSSATPVYNQIKQHIVYLTFDWNKKAGDGIATNTYYFVKPTSWGSKINAFAWEGAQTLGEWPGQAMTKITDDLYSFDLAATYTNIIFVEVNNDGEAIKQTEDLTLSTTTPYFTANSSAETSGKYSGTWGADAPAALADYYVTGTIGGVNKWYTEAGFVAELAMTTQEDANENVAILSGLELEAGDQLKVISKSGTYYGAPGDGNVYVEEDGTYNVYLRRDVMKVFISKVTA